MDTVFSQIVSALEFKRKNDGEAIWNFHDFTNAKKEVSAETIHGNTVWENSTTFKIY